MSDGRGRRADSKRTDESDAAGGSPPVLDLRDDRATDSSRTGGKGAALSRLLRANLPVPGGFCVTTEVYRAVADDPAIGAALDRLAALGPDDLGLPGAAREVRSLLGDRPLPESARTAIVDALSDVDGPVAVRSSATAEDLPEASFAGQHDTFLNVPREDVPDRVHDCLAGTFTDRAVTYRARNGLPHTPDTVAMAVVVQPMVDAESAGVLFTADPSTGNRHVASVDAGFGLGEALVGGETTPDTVRIDRRTDEVLDYVVGEKRVVSRLREGGGTEHVDLPVDRRAARVLSDEQVRELVALGDRAESLLGSPQDVEWALVGTDFVLLQSRPITSLFPLPDPLPADDRLHVYLSVGHMQALPEALPPLVRDVWTSYVEQEPEAFGIERVWTRPAVEAGGRVYVDTTPLLRVGFLRRNLPDLLANVNEPASRGLADLLERREAEFRRDRRSLAALPALVGTLLTLGALALRVLPRTLLGVFGTLAGRPRDAERVGVWFEVWARRAANDATAPATTEGRVRRAFDSLDIPELLADLYPRIAPLFTAFAIGGWLKRRFPDAPDAVDEDGVPAGRSGTPRVSDDVNAVGRGFERELVTRLNLGLGDLADVAREHPAVADALREGASLEDVESVPGGRSFRFALDRYLDEFGHRATGEIDLSRPRWREDPSPLLGAIRANLADGGEAETPTPGEHRERVRRLAREAEAAAARLEARADHGLLGPLRRRLVRHLVRVYRRFVMLREYPKHGTAHLFTAWRTVFLEAGTRLADEGVLDSPGDVWFLRREELLAALDDGLIDVDIDARRREFERHVALDAPPLLTSEGEAAVGHVDRTHLPPGTLVGTGVSSGVVEGVARVVRDPRTATVERGEILVAPSSDPGWTPLFLNAAGMVVEVGGPVSHGALVAREYGLPAVVSVPGATRAIRTGQRVRIDGARGTVELLDDGETDEGDGSDSEAGRSGQTVRR